jgi:hypothetical protein
MHLKAIFVTYDFFVGNEFERISNCPYFKILAVEFVEY